MKKTITKLKFAAIAAGAFMCLQSVNAQTYNINTVAGKGTAGYSGDGGAATAAMLNSTTDVIKDASGNMYIVDHNNSVIRKVSTTGIITTVAGTAGSAGYTGDGGAATAAKLNQDFGIAFDNAGNLYIAEYGNNCIREVNTSGIISTVAGNGTAGYTGDGGQATAAELWQPNAIVIDALGNMYVSDWANNRIREVNTSGIITTIAGTGTAGYTGDGGAATVANLHHPYCMAFGASGNLNFSDNANNVIRKIDKTSGIISTVVGNGTSGNTGDGGAATAAEINSPRGISFDASGNMYFAEFGSAVIREVNTGAIITTIAGNGTAGYTGDGGTATAAELKSPDGITTDASGNIYIADNGNNVIRELTPSVAAQALNFNGTNNYCSSAVFSTIVDSLTLEARVNWTGTNGHDEMIVTNGNTGSAGYAVYINNANADSLSVLIGGIYIMNASVKLTTGTWHMVSVVRKSGIWTLYVDGVAYVLTGNFTTPHPVIGAFAIGSDQAGNSPFFGTIDEVRFWGRPLCQNEIQDRLSCSLKGNEAGLIAYYNFNEGINSANNSAITTLADSSGNVHNLTLTNFTLNGTTSNWIAPSGTLSGSCGTYIPSAPSITTTGVTTFCQGDSVLLIASAGSSYSWSNGKTTQSITAVTGGNYVVSVINPGGCYGVNKDSIAVTVNPLPNVSIVAPLNICAGASDTLNGQGAITYSWITEQTSNPIIVSPTTATTYTVTGTDVNGCTNTASININVNPLPTITITGNDSASIGHPDVLTATGGGSYLWTTGSTHDTTIVSPTVATTYSVKVTDSLGCSAVDSFKVSIKVITTGIATLTESNGTNLYPNPANTVLNLSFTMQGSSTNATINVLDVTGKSLLQTSTEISNGKTLPINISQLPAGIYFIKIATEKNTQTIKFVKTDQ